MLSFGDDTMTSRNGPRSVSGVAGSGSRSVTLGSVPQSSVSSSVEDWHLSEKGQKGGGELCAFKPIVH